MNIAVVGGGISGLTTAFRLRKAGASVTLFDASDRVGGNIQTVEQEGYLFENGPNSLVANNDLLELIAELGLSGEILKPRVGSKK